MGTIIWVEDYWAYHTADHTNLSARFYGFTALHSAAQDDRKDFVRLLIDSSDDVNLETEHAETTPHIAVCSGHESVAKLLKDSKIDTAAGDEDGWIALFIAAWEGNRRLAKLLIACGLDVNGLETSASGC